MLFSKSVAMDGLWGIPHLMVLGIADTRFVVVNAVLTVCVENQPLMLRIIEH